MTPPAIAKQMCSFVEIPCSDWVVLDPSCGDGNLLMAAAEIMLEKGVKDVCARLIGFDIDDEMVSKTKSRLSQLLNCLPSALNIYHQDFLSVQHEDLLSSNSTKLLANVTVVLSNPPYGITREYKFFDHAHHMVSARAILIFLVPLAFIDRIIGVSFIPLSGRPMGVTTGHAITKSTGGQHYKFKSVKGLNENSTSFIVESGIKLYAVGSGSPPQTKEIVEAKPYSSVTPLEGWLPCVRTGDVQPFKLIIERLWVSYGQHLAHPKIIERFTGPKIFLRRMPTWANKKFSAVFDTSVVLCAGDILVIRHRDQDSELLKGLCMYLNSKEAADFIFSQRPSLGLRDSFPKISATDVNALLKECCPLEVDLRALAAEYPQHESVAA